MALVAAVAGMAVAGLSLTIYLLQGGGIPDVNPAKAFASAIALELLLVPLGVAIAWMQLARFFALRHPADDSTSERKLAA